jgi:hypothetical protein
VTQKHERGRVDDDKVDASDIFSVGHGTVVVVGGGDDESAYRDGHKDNGQKYLEQVVPIKRHIATLTFVVVSDFERQVREKNGSGDPGQDRALKALCKLRLGRVPREVAAPEGAAAKLLERTQVWIFGFHGRRRMEDSSSFMFYLYIGSNKAQMSATYPGMSSYMRCSISEIN